MWIVLSSKYQAHDVGLWASCFVDKEPPMWWFRESLKMSRLLPPLVASHLYLGETRVSSFLIEPCITIHTRSVWMKNSWCSVHQWLVVQRCHEGVQQSPHLHRRELQLPGAFHSKCCFVWLYSTHWAEWEFTSRGRQRFVLLDAEVLSFISSF